MKTQKTQVAIIGAGPGGYAAAFRAADLGLQVSLIDPAPNPGGVCLYRGCIPSKALLHLAKIIFETQRADAWGLKFDQPEINFAKVMTWKQSVINKLTGGLGQLLKQRKISYVQGLASFLDAQTLRVDALNGGQSHLQFDQAILATGSRPLFPFDLALADSPHILNSTSVLELAAVPQSLLVIGGGYIGLEMASVYSALGCKVSVVEVMSGLLPGCDRDLVRILEKNLKKHVAEIMLSTRVEKLEPSMDGVRVVLKSESTTTEKHYEKILVSVGRTPNSSGLGLENTQVVIDKQGFVAVNASRQTAEKNIYAIGDLTGNPMLAHKATHEGLVAAENIAGQDVRFEPRAIPAVIFTDPEIAWCGLSEEEAKKSAVPHTVARFPWAASGRALTMGAEEGLTKLIINPETEEILGTGIVGANAGDLIGEAVVAMEMGATASDLALSIHAHPTLSETLMEAAEVFFGKAIHLYRPRKS